MMVYRYLSVLPLIYGAMAPATASAADYPWGASTVSGFEINEIYGQIVNGVYSAGPPGFEASSVQLSAGTLFTDYQGIAKSSLELRQIDLDSFQGTPLYGDFAESLTNLRPVTDRLTLGYKVKWDAFAGFDLKGRGESGILKFSLFADGENLEDWTIDLVDSPCPYTNQSCGTSNVFILDGIPTSIYYSLSFISASLETHAIGAPQYFDYKAELDIGIGEIIPCPTPPNTLPGGILVYTISGVSYCGVPVDHDRALGLGDANPRFNPFVLPGAVPEIETWLSMTLGFAAMGWRLRRPRRPAVSRMTGRFALAPA